MTWGPTLALGQAGSAGEWTDRRKTTPVRRQRGNRFPHEQKRNAREEIAFPDEQKRNAREQIAFPDEQK